MGLNKDYIDALSDAAVRLSEQATNVTLNAYSQTAPEASLEIIGRDRNIPRFPQETEVEKYRLRVVDAYNGNIALGNAADIIRVVEGHSDQLGSPFVFFGIPGGHDQGFPAGTVENKFKLIVRTLSGGVMYDGAQQYDGTVKYDAIGINAIRIEIKRPGATVSTDIKLKLVAALKTVIRASINNIVIKDIP